MKLEEIIAKERKKIPNETIPYRFKDEMIARIHKGIEAKRRKRRLIVNYSYGVAAAIAVVLAVGLIALPISNSKKTIAEVEMYHTLTEEIKELNSNQRNEHIKRYIEKTLKDITEDEKSIEEQLQEQMPRKKFEEVIREYYREKNKGLKKLLAFADENN